MKSKYRRLAQVKRAERKASEVRLRAERRTGELLKELARATPQDRADKANATQGRSSNGATNVDSPYADALQQTGISRQTASRYQALANVPAPVFEQALGERTDLTSPKHAEKCGAPSAERRTGELLKELARATPADRASAGGSAKAAMSNDATKQPSPYAQALADTGISTRVPPLRRACWGGPAGAGRWWLPAGCISSDPAMTVL